VQSFWGVLCFQFPQLSFEEVQVVRLPFDVYIKELMVEPNQKVSADEVLLKVENSDVIDNFSIAAAEKKVADKMMFASVGRSAAEQKVRHYEQSQSAGKLKLAATEFERQTVRSEKEGVVVECLSSQDVGAYWEQGTELARIGQGERIVRVLLDDRKITESRPEVGDKVNVRLKDSKTQACSGRITRVEPGGNNMVDMEGLTQSAGGDIIADQEGRTQEVYFIVDIALEESVAADVPQNTTACVRFSRRFESLGAYALRHFRMFANELFSK